MNKLFKYFFVIVVSLISLCQMGWAGQVYYDQPAFGSVANSVLVDPSSVSAGQLHLIQWTPNPSSSKGDIPVGWNVGAYTGFVPPSPLANYQVGVSNTTIGSSAIQANQKTGAFLIDSNSLKTSSTTNPTLFPMIAHYDFTTSAQFQPFLQPGKTLVYAIEAEVPTAQSDNSTAYVYATMYFNFEDTTTGLHFWYGGGMFDNRGYAWVATGYDSGTNQAIVSTQLGKNSGSSAEATDLATSSPFQGKTWQTYLPFQFAISAANFQNAINSVKSSYSQQYGAMSTNPANFKLTHFNLNPEVAYYGGEGVIGMSFRNIRISTQDSNDCYNTYNGVNQYTGLTNGDQRYLCSQGNWYQCGVSPTNTWSIASANAEIFGSHSCSLSTSTWLSSSGATAPKMTIQPESQSVVPYNNVTLTAGGSGSPQPTYQWYFNGSPIKGATSWQYSFTTSLSSYGTYTVVLTNSAGSVTSAAAQLSL